MSGVRTMRAVRVHEHGDLDVHYGVDFENKVHFALHPPGDFNLTEAGTASVKVAFTVPTLSEAVARLADAGHSPFIAPHDEGFGPVAAFKRCVVVDRLPKTRSGKILRGTMRKIADGESWTVPATIDEPAILDEIAAALAADA